LDGAYEAVANDGEAAPEPVKEAARLINANFSICVDVPVYRVHRASASCCEGEFEDSICVDDEVEEVVKWDKLPQAYQDYQRDFTAHKEDADPIDADQFDKGMFNGCGLDRLQASKRIPVEDVVVLIPRAAHHSSTSTSAEQRNSTATP
jgi:hypothetical protein